MRNNLKRISLTISLLTLFTMIYAGIPRQPFDRIGHLGVEDGLSNNYVVGLTQDRKGFVWIATESGLNRFDGRQFISYNKSNSALSSNELNTVLADPDADKVWVGTQRNGLCCFDYTTETFTHFEAGKQGMLTNDITRLSPAAQGGIWVTHYFVGLALLDTETQTFESYSASVVKGMKTPNWTAVDDGEGHLYVGHVNDGFSIVSIKDKKVLSNYRHDPDNPDGSLPGNEVFAICIDRNKSVWIGTDKGLALFNPRTKRFTIFKHDGNDSQSLLPGQIRDIRQMKDGSLWIATNMGGVSILNFDNNTFTNPKDIRFINLTPDNYPAISGPHVRCILQDTFGNIWLGNYRDGVDFISHEPAAFATIAYAPQEGGKRENKPVWGMHIDREGRIYLGGENEMAVCEEGKTMQIIPLPTARRIQTHINCIYEDNTGTLWLGTNETGLLLYQPQTKRFRTLTSEQPAPNDIRCILPTAGKLWIGSKTGIYSYTAGSNRLKYEQQLTEQLWDRIVTALLTDKQGNLWVGTFGKGICIFSPEGRVVQRLTDENGFPSNAINQLFTDSQGRIWAATREGAVRFSDSSTPQVYRIFDSENGLENTRVRAICEDEKQQIWISTNSGISQIDEENDTTYNYNHRDGVPMGDFMDASVCQSPDGNLIFGSQNGACYFNPQTLTKHHDVAPVVITQFFTYNSRTGREEDRVAIPIGDNKLELSHDQNTIRICFNVPDYSQSRQVEFAYTLDGLESAWYSARDENQAIYRNLRPGNYKFMVRTRFRNQPWEEQTASLRICILPPLWQTWYARLAYFMLAAGIAYILILFYKRKLKLESSLKVEREKSHNEQELNNERLRFYTNITHELRTPLTLILGPLEDLMSDHTLAPRHANKINIIHSSATRLLNLINGILEFRKTETQNRKLTVSKGDIKQLVQEVGLRYKELNQNPDVAIHINIETEDTHLFFDTEMITIILDNLMSNAIKYTSKGDITMTLRALEEGGVRYTEISVSDTGHGIAADALPHIFERYYQANSKYQASGSGIGLALVKSLADLHEANLSVNSRVEEGTTFTIRLLTDNTYPNAIHAAEPQTEDEKLPSTENAEDTRPLLLVVEDNHDIAEYIRSSFCDTFEVLVASNGKEGWEIAENHIPNIIVSDIMMPVMDGIELCRRVKEDMRTSHIPVILLTAKDSLSDKETGYTAGADSYLTKPFSAKLLQSRINNLLDARRRIAEMLAENNAKLPDEDEKAPRLNKLDNEFLHQIIAIIEGNLEMEKMDIAFIADKMCMSHSTLYRKIKGLTNMSTNEFIRKIKMRNSRELMRSGQHTISEIAYMTGFNSVSYFRQCFKTEFGISPSEFIKQQE